MLNKYELINITGGAITASYITAIVRGINSLLELGRSLGTVIRRVISRKMC